MIVILIICFGAIVYMLLGQNTVVEYDENTLDNDLLSSDFIQVRKTKKVDEIINSLDMKFTEYDIYKRMKGGVSLPMVEKDDIGNAKPFQVKEFIQERF